MGKSKIQKAQKATFGHTLLCRIFGTIFLLFPLAVYVALIGYNADDPSFNKVTSAESNIHNYLGTFGAYTADAVLSTFGLSLIVFLFIPIIWGYGLWRYNAFSEYKSRIFAWFVGLLCFACFLNLTCSKYLGSFNLPYNLTGDWSIIVSRPLNTLANNFNLPYNTWLLKAIILFLSIFSFNFAAGLTCKRWLRWFAAIISLLFSLIKKIWHVCKKLFSFHSFNEFKEINPNYLPSKTRKLRREPAFDNQIPNAKANNPTITQATNNSANDTDKQNLIIEVPQNINQAQKDISKDKSEITRSATFNPTFEFINQSKLSDKIGKKLLHKADSQTSNKDNMLKTQEELLQIKTKQDAKSNYTRQEQISADKEKNIKPTESVKQYKLPDINLLSAHSADAMIVDEEALKRRAAQLETILNDFNIQGQIVKVSPGPVVTLYELEPKSGTKTARVIGLSDDIARSMAVSSVRMAVVSGKSTIGIELPNEKRQTVWLRELLEDKEFSASKNILNVALGKDIGGKHMYADISKMPHLLVAGTTGSGKSVGVNSMILSLLYRMTPEQCKFIMIDPKQLEFSMYNGIPHLLTPVITDPAKAVVGLKWAVQEMENRYRSMSLLNVRNIAGYNKKVEELSKSGQELKKTIQTGFDKETGLPIYEEQVIDTKPMPYIVIVVDEMADLMLVAGKEVEAAIQRLAQMARAAGIHLIMSTQRPSVDVITGVIKANFPSRLSFHVTTRGDSITILGEKGAEQLLGMGDMLYMPSGLRPLRIHGCFVPDEEVEKIVEYIKAEGEPQYVAEVTAGELNTKDSGPVFDKGEMSTGDSEEDLYRQAVDIVRTDKKASTSYIQRKLRIGYNRAANLIDRMEREGVVTKQDHVGRREVIGVD